MRVVLFGATGVAGRGVLQACLAADEVARVTAVVRRPTGVEAPKLAEVHCDDFHHPPVPGDADACFYCLGISAMIEKDPARYRA